MERDVLVIHGPQKHLILLYKWFKYSHWDIALGRTVSILLVSALSVLSVEVLALRRAGSPTTGGGGKFNFHISWKLERLNVLSDLLPGSFGTIGDVLVSYDCSKAAYASKDSIRPWGLMRDS